MERITRSGQALDESGAFSRTACWVIAVLSLLAAWAPGSNPRLVAGGDFVLDGPARFFHWAVATTIALAAIVAAASRPSRATVVSLALAAAAAALWLAGASTLDVALMAVLWGAGWILVAASVAHRQGSAIRIEVAVKLQGLGTVSALTFILAAALLVGLAGTSHVLEAGYVLARLPDSSVLAMATVRILLVACALGAAWVPFHMWAPDGLSAAPRPVAMILAVSAPLAASLTMARITYALQPTLTSLEVHWQGGLFAIACLTVILAGSVALVQRDAVRLLAYLCVIQGAELIPAIVVSPGDGGALVEAGLAHVAALVPAWLALAVWSGVDGSDTSFARLAGGGRRAPIRAALVVSAFALAAGFPGGVRFLARPEAAVLASPQAGWGIVFLVSTLLQWAAVVRLIRVLFLDSGSLEDRQRSLPPIGIAWVVVALVLALEVAIALVAWPPVGFGEAWRTLLPGG